jgi:hypothetical protein
MVSVLDNGQTALFFCGLRATLEVVAFKEDHAADA